MVHALTVDTETTTDAAQALQFGAFRYCRLDGTTVTTVAEGLIHADGLPAYQVERLRAYARARKADVDLTYPAVEPLWELQVMSAPSSSTAGCGTSAIRTTPAATRRCW